MRHKNNTLLLSLTLNTLLTAIEILVGVISGSLSLVADGSRNLTDSIMLIVSYIAERLSKRKADGLRTWGYGRVKIIASLLNTGIILTIAIIIGYEALLRLHQPKAVHGLTVALVAALSVLINGIAARLLRSQREDINIRTAYTGLFYGAISSATVLVAGLLIALFKWEWLDAVTGFMIAAMLLLASIKLARDAIHILLEGVPVSVDLQTVRQQLLAIKQVVSMQEVHAWTLEHNNYAFSCHLIIEPTSLAHSLQLVNEAKAILKQAGFTHVTIEVDVVADDKPYPNP
jgi:cobalt-zinc-cadmium efflux system protein